MYVQGVPVSLTEVVAKRGRKILLTQVAVKCLQNIKSICKNIYFLSRFVKVCSRHPVDFVFLHFYVF